MHLFSEISVESSIACDESLEVDADLLNGGGYVRAKHIPLSNNPRKDFSCLNDAATSTSGWTFGDFLIFASSRTALRALLSRLGHKDN